MKGHAGGGDERHVSQPWPNCPPLCQACGMPMAGGVIGYHPECNPARPGTVASPLRPGVTIDPAADLRMTPEQFRERYTVPARVHDLERRVALLEADYAAIRRLVERGC